MEKAESELRTVALDVLTKLHLAEGLDTLAAERMKQALRAAAKSWAESDVITKSAANLLVDLANSIEASSYTYKDDEAARIRDLAYEVADLVRDCVTVEGGFDL